MLGNFIKILSAIVEGLNLNYSSQYNNTEGYFISKIAQVPQKIGVLKVLEIELWFIAKDGTKSKVFSFTHTGTASNDIEYMNYLNGAITIFTSKVLTLVAIEEGHKYD